VRPRAGESSIEAVDGSHLACAANPVANLRSRIVDSRHKLQLYFRDVPLELFSEHIPLLCIDWSFMSSRSGKIVESSMFGDMQCYSATVSWKESRFANEF
jgi:hypothetical protein